MEGRNTIVIDGLDSVGTPVGLSLSVQVTLDTKAPAPAEQEVESYVQEIYMQPAQDADGNIQMPVVWKLGAPKSSLKYGVVKSRVRSNWGESMPSAEVLETTNPTNTPFYQVAIPFNAEQDSPISGVEYCIGESCGAALVSPKSTSTRLLYDIPIASNNVPALNTTAGFVNLPAKAKVTDAAGNVAEVALTPLSYWFVATGIQVKRDVSYGQGTPTDPFSSRFYTRQRGNLPAINRVGDTYPSLRFERFILTNPSTLPVPVTVSRSGGVQIRQTWKQLIVAPPRVSSDTFLSPDGRAWPMYRNMRSGPALGCSVEAFPCQNISSDSYFPVYSAAGTTCSSFPVNTESSRNFDEPLHVEAYLPKASPSEEIEHAPDHSYGEDGYHFSLPAARGTAPGTMVLYVVRLRVADMIPPEAQLQDLGVARSTVQIWRGDGWRRVGNLTPCCLGAVCSQFEAARWLSELVYSSERVTGTLSFQTSDHEYIKGGISMGAGQVNVDVQVLHENMLPVAL